MSHVISIKLEEERRQGLNEAAEIIKRGGVIAFPTDTVYGIASSAFNENAIERIYAIKERDHAKSIPILLGDISQAPIVAKEFSVEARQLADRFWPGGLTIIVGKNEKLPKNISVYDTIGIRIPDYPFVRELIRKTGPLAVTSANHSGDPSAVQVDDFLSVLGDKLDLVIDGGKTTGGVSSTVVDCSGDKIKLLRAGAIPPSALGIE